MPNWIDLDEKDSKLLEKITKAWQNQKYIKVGDFIKFNNGEYARIAHVWTDKNNQPNEIQPNASAYGSSFYVGIYQDRAYMSFSGGLYPSIPISKFKLTDEVKTGLSWFFHHDMAGANRGVFIKLPCQVWECNKNSNGFNSD